MIYHLPLEVTLGPPDGQRIAIQFTAQKRRTYVLETAPALPAAVWSEIDDRAHRTWARAVKYYESLRFVYEIQSRLKEWTEQDGEDPGAAPGSQTAPETAGPGESSAGPGAKGRQEKK